MKRAILCVCTALLLCHAPRVAFAQGVGAVGGIVTDSSGGVLPGAAVSLVTPGVIGGTQQTITDGRGTYQFVRLVPGTYSVKAELQGFRTTTRENIIVNADVTARADLALEVGSLAEGVTVAAKPRCSIPRLH